MKILLFTIMFLFSCGNEVVECAFKGCPSKRNPVPEVGITAEQIVQLKDLEAAITWAPKCAAGIACEEDSDGDAMLWAGLLCSVGYSEQCTAVKLSQRSDGRLCRSPARCNQETNAFSRDMLLGKLASLTVTKDTESAKSLVSYLKNNGYKLCPLATDNRCDLEPVKSSAIWGTMKRVWQYLGLQPTSEMEFGDISDNKIINLESQFAISNGYQLHLVAIELYTRQQMGVFTQDLQQAADNILARQPNNPFYEYVARGKTNRAAQLVLDKCPKERPERAVQWSWQRDEKEQAWKQSMGWECLFMIKVLTK